METIFRKISAKDRLPKVKGYFHVEEDGLLEHYLLYDPEYDSWYDSEKYTWDIDFWLEEIELPMI